MSTITAVATYGLELAEIGGTLAAHVQAGDTVNACVLLAHPDNHAPVRRAARHLGISDVTFLQAEHGGLDGAEGRALRDRLIAYLRSAAPDTVLMPDPVHALGDLDPDRRPASDLVLEASSLCGRDWREDELGKACRTPQIYYYAPGEPTCVVDVSATFPAKLAALAELDYQAVYSAQVIAGQLGERGWEVLSSLAGEAGDRSTTTDARRLLVALQTAHALHHGAGGHSRAALAEPFRHSTVITLPRLM